MPRLVLQEMKVLGFTSQRPLLILRTTDVLCVVDARITITQYPVYLRTKQTLQTKAQTHFKTHGSMSLTSRPSWCNRNVPMETEQGKRSKEQRKQRR